MKEHDIDLGSSYAIGDRMRDLSICRVGGCQGFLVGNTEETDVIEAAKSGKYLNVRYGSDLFECARMIYEG